MKKLVLPVAALLLVALPAMAYVQPGSLNQKAKVGATPTKSSRTTQNMDGGSGVGGSTNSRERVGSGATTTDPFADTPVQSDAPTKPVPEPGTMAMASMGLLAIGAALRHKRGR